MLASAVALDWHSAVRSFRSSVKKMEERNDRQCIARTAVCHVQRTVLEPGGALPEPLHSLRAQQVLYRGHFRCETFEQVKLVRNGRIHEDHSDDALPVQIRKLQRVITTEGGSDHHIGALDAGHFQGLLEVFGGVDNVLRLRARSAEAVPRRIPGTDARSARKGALNLPPPHRPMAEPGVQDDCGRPLPKTDQIDGAPFWRYALAVGAPGRARSAPRTSRQGRRDLLA